MTPSGSNVYTNPNMEVICPSRNVLDLGIYKSATLAQWGERSLSVWTAQIIFPVRPDKTYTVFC